MTKLFPFRAPSRNEWECACGAVNSESEDYCWDCGQNRYDRSLPCGCTLEGFMCEEHRP